MSVKQLTTTSYAILALLAVRPWSAYELAQQGRRQMGYFWPRGERGLYSEPKNLVAHQLASATKQRRGRQDRTEYSITDAGRRALRSWLAQPSQPPQFESEAVLRLAFAEHGSMRDASATLAELQAHAQQGRHEARIVAREYVEGAGPYPERVHLVTLVTVFFADYFDLIDAWSTWASEQIASWENQTQTDTHTQALAALERIAALAPHRPPKSPL
jgi:PadR family transcriptional regulator AphA